MGMLNQEEKKIKVQICNFVKFHKKYKKTTLIIPYIHIY